MENNANAPLMDRDDHSVDTHHTLDMPALYNSNASLAEHQRVTNPLEGIANLSLEDQKLHINLDDNLDTTQQPPTVTAVQSGSMASPEPDHTHDTVPKRFIGVALDNTPVPATRNTSPGEWSNLDESSLKTSETQRDHSGAAVAGAVTPLVFSHQHADGSLTRIEIYLSIQIGNHNHTVINENGLRPSS